MGNLPGSSRHEKASTSRIHDTTKVATRRATETLLRPENEKGNVVKAPEPLGGRPSITGIARKPRAVMDPKQFEQFVMDKFDQRLNLAFSSSRSLASSRAGPRAALRETFATAMRSSELLLSSWSAESTDLLVNSLLGEAIPIYFGKGDVLFEANTHGQILYVVAMGSLEMETRPEDLAVARGRALTDVVANAARANSVHSQVSSSPVAHHGHTRSSGAFQEFQKLKGQPSIVTTLEPGTVIADYCLVTNLPHRSTVRGKRPGLLLAIHRLQYQVVAMKVRTEMASGFLENATDDSLCELVQRVPLFASLTREQLESLASKFVTRLYVPGEHIVRSGDDSAAGLYVILSGEVSCRAPKSVFKSSKSKLEQTASRKKITSSTSLNRKSDDQNEISWLRPGDHFGESSLLEDESGVGGSCINYVASEDRSVHCLMLSKAEFLSFIKDHGAPLLDLIRHVHSVRLMERNPLFAELSSDEIRTIASHAHVHHFDNGFDFRRELINKDKLFLIVQGALKIEAPYEPSFDEDEFEALDRSLRALRTGKRFYSEQNSKDGGISDITDSFLDRVVTASNLEMEMPEDSEFSVLVGSSSEFLEATAEEEEGDGNGSSDDSAYSDGKSTNRKSVAKNETAGSNLVTENIQSSNGTRNSKASRKSARKSKGKPRTSAKASNGAASRDRSSSPSTVRRDDSSTARRNGSSTARRNGSSTARRNGSSTASTPKGRPSTVASSQTSISEEGKTPKTRRPRGFSLGFRKKWASRAMKQREAKREHNRTSSLGKFLAWRNSQMESEEDEEAKKASKSQVVGTTKTRPTLDKFFKHNKAKSTENVKSERTLALDKERVPDFKLEGSTLFNIDPRLVGVESELSDKPVEGNWAVLIEGDTFGEECLLNQTPEYHDRPLQHRPLGRITCLSISIELLNNCGVYDKVLSTLMHVPGESDLNVVEDQHDPETPLKQTFSGRFMRLGDMILNSVHNSKVDGVLSSMRDRNNMRRVRLLHKTDLTDVSLVLHKPTGQLCVLKSINVEVANKQGAGQMIFNESSILSQLASPFIIRMLNTWDEPRQMVVALEPLMGGDVGELVDDACRHSLGLVPRLTQMSFSGPGSFAAWGKHIGDIVGNRGALTFQHCRFVAACITLALKHLFEHRVCHRDIKPCNFMIDHHGFVKLVDFGISKQLLVGSDRTFTAIGSPNYMAPEMLSFEGYGTAVDWWALGATLFELAVGYNPFEDGPDSPALTLSVSRYRILEYSHRCKNTPNKRQSFEVRGPNPNAADEIFNPLREEKRFDDIKQDNCATDEQWAVFADLVAGLMGAQSFQRYGSIGYADGPRGVLKHPLFAGDASAGIEPMDWKMLTTRKETAPYVPTHLLVRPKSIAEMVSSSSTSSDTPQPGIRRCHNNKQVPTERPSMVRSIDDAVRGELENNTNGLMQGSIRTLESRRRIQMLRYKSTAAMLKLKPMSHANASGIGAVSDLAVSANRRAVVVERVHLLSVVRKRVYEGVHSLAAVTIQRVYRGFHTRKSFAERFRELRGSIVGNSSNNNLDESSSKLDPTSSETVVLHQVEQEEQVENTSELKKPTKSSKKKEKRRKHKKRRTKKKSNGNPRDAVSEGDALDLL